MKYTTHRLILDLAENQREEVLMNDGDFILRSIRPPKFIADIFLPITILQVIAKGVDHTRPPAIDIDILESDVNRATPIGIVAIERDLNLVVKVVSPALASVIDDPDKLPLANRFALDF
jgi:hypothetical protein